MTERSPHDPVPRWLLVAGLGACLLYLLAEGFVLGWDLGFPLDDSWIHLQFARHLAVGEGLAYNPGELVTGSTAPLWTALLSLLFLLPGSEVLWAKVLGMGLHLACLHATWRLGRELELPRRLASLAVFLTLATPWLVWSALSAMEVPLFILLSLWGITLHLRERRRRERPPLSLGILALAVLARPEGALLLVLAVADRLFLPRRTSPPTEDTGSWSLGTPPWRRLAVGLGLGALALGGTLVFYQWAAGSLLPTTFAVKGHGLQRLLPEPLYLKEILGLLFPAQPWMVLLAGAGVLVLLERLGGPRDTGLLPALWLLGLPLAYSLMSPLGRGLIAGNFGRYYFPLFPVLILLGVLGLERVARTLASPAPGDRAGRWIAVCLAVVLVAPTVAALVRGAPAYVKNVTDVQDSDVRMARFLAPRLHPEALLAVNDIGAFKYFLPNPVLDLVGIASPEIRLHRQRRQAEGVGFYDAMVEYLAEHRPDYVAIFPSWLPRMVRDPRFEPLYVLSIPDNRTMGGDEIVLFSTPWTRYPLAEPPGLSRQPGDPVPIPVQTPPSAVDPPAEPPIPTPPNPPPGEISSGDMDGHSGPRPVPR